ncbi:Vasoactive intestinal polypeptide receptor 2 [Willisornis vidua]|uniref:Vasoactive intestinal polypeptide receptor 2 n=1 Tax=Willisornis vidua TaxID=1566151 RepID=A0ABQ9CX01_9PASS|nr:Vasoactive intestinal polypeptide receptor 2 [Willisornis vidua]
MRNLPILLLSLCWSLGRVSGIHPECRFQLEIHKEETRCMELLKNAKPVDYKAFRDRWKETHICERWIEFPENESLYDGFRKAAVMDDSPEILRPNELLAGQRIVERCVGVWDNITCWRPAKIGETVTVPCPKVFSLFSGKPGNISKNCTSNGWSDIFPDILSTCGYNDYEDDYKVNFYVRVKAIYTLGHSVSLIALTTGSIILCLFRKLHCTRNYIHLNLFLSFILRAVSVLVKDDILYSSSNTAHCPEDQTSWVGCKAILVFFQYGVMANFYWLLVEGLYLHILLVLIFSPNRHFTIYLLIGWGIPTIFIITWTVTRIILEDTGCWDTNEHGGPWWVIRIPILISILVNFILFISIIRILLQKLRSPDVGGNDQSQYKRLAKSTLLLIPLFGVHYTVFALFPDRSSNNYKIIFELCLGSFQGLIVAVLYCFLNSEREGMPKMGHELAMYTCSPEMFCIKRRQGQQAGRGDCHQCKRDIMDLLE